MSYAVVFCGFTLYFISEGFDCVLGWSVEEWTVCCGERGVN